jgi:cytoskeletal protein RodZ
LGDLLRVTREQRGATIEEAAETTRISKSYLVALEAEAFDKLPSIVYAKGFLRVYATYLGLSVGEVVRMFDAAVNGQSREKPVVAEGHDMSAKAAHHPRKRWLFRSVPLFLAIMLAGYYLTHDEEGKGRLARQTVAALPVQQMPVHARQSSARTEAPKQQPQPVADLPAEAPQARPGLVLRLKANEECWLAVTIDDNVSQTYLLKPGDLIEWMGEKSFSLDVGNAGGIEAEFNGKPLKPLGEKGKPVHLVLKPEDNEER